MTTAQKSSSGIRIERPDSKKLENMGIKKWPIWTKEPSRFNWHYGDSEVCYILEGEATIETKTGPIEIKPGDLVTFPSALDCVWEIHKTIRKHYSFE